MYDVQEKYFEDGFGQTIGSAMEGLAMFDDLDEWDLDKVNL